MKNKTMYILAALAVGAVAYYYFKKGKKESSTNDSKPKEDISTDSKSKENTGESSSTKSSGGKTPKRVLSPEVLKKILRQKAALGKSKSMAMGKQENAEENSGFAFNGHIF